LDYGVEVGLRSRRGKIRERIAKKTNRKKYKRKKNAAIVFLITYSYFFNNRSNEIKIDLI
jgi:hypothetical protein